MPKQLMSQDNSELKAELLAAWLEASLTEQQQQQFEQLLMDDSEFAARVEQADAFAQLSGEFQAGPLPDWQPETVFPAENAISAKGQPLGQESGKHKWWRWQGLPIASFALSLLAIVLVSTNFTISHDERGLLLSFGDSLNDQQVESMVAQLTEQRLAEYVDAQRSLWQEKEAQLQQQQQRLNGQFAEYLLTANRNERREDFVELIKFVNQQRSDDQIFYTKQLNQLERGLSQRLPGDRPVASATTNPITLDQ